MMTIFKRVEPGVYTVIKSEIQLGIITKVNSADYYGIYSVSFYEWIFQPANVNAGCTRFGSFKEAKIKLAQ